MQALSGPVVLLGYGQNYGYGNYGNAVYPTTPFAVVGGYGGDPYGLGPYGSIELNPPFITSAISLDGFRVEVFFSEPMDIENAALLNAASYALVPLLAAEVTILSVAIGTISDVNILENITASGATSIILTHTGTTLGGAYRLTIGSPSGDPMALDAPSDISGNPIIVPAQVGELFYSTIALSADFSNGDAIGVFVPLDVGGAGVEVTLTAGVDFAFVLNNPVDNAQNLAAGLAGLAGLTATNLVNGVPSATVTVTAVKPT
ncbi:MAG: hypothetical protein HN344_10740, partial [Gammaproteobacteria bacterium]|nr:hypothetical protein [Gammaproteobacteria bacterium]